MAPRCGCVLQGMSVVPNYLLIGQIFGRVAMQDAHETHQSIRSKNMRTVLDL